MGLESCIMASLLALACQTNVERAGQLVSFELSHSCLVFCQLLSRGARLCTAVSCASCTATSQGWLVSLICMRAAELHLDCVDYVLSVCSGRLDSMTLSSICRMPFQSERTHSQSSVISLAQCPAVEELKYTDSPLALQYTEFKLRTSKIGDTSKFC